MFMRPFCLVPSFGVINRMVIGCQVELKIAMGGLRGRSDAQKRGNHQDLSSRLKKGDSLPFCVAKSEGEGPETAAATVEGLAFSNRPQG